MGQKSKDVHLISWLELLQQFDVGLSLTDLQGQCFFSSHYFNFQDRGSLSFKNEYHFLESVFSKLSATNIEEESVGEKRKSLKIRGNINSEILFRM